MAAIGHSPSISPAVSPTATKTFGYVRTSQRDRDTATSPDYHPVRSVRRRDRVSSSDPVYVLSNRHDFSSAEDFILAMRGTGSATIVGDTTAGVTGGPIVRELANGWTYELSQWIEYTADKKAFEGVGIAPDVVVKSNAADGSRQQAILRWRKRARLLAAAVSPLNR